jgi:hypothetical protein
LAALENAMSSAVQTGLVDPQVVLIEARRHRRARRIADAKFPRLKRLSEFNVDAVKTIEPAQLATLASGNYLSPVQ